MSALDDTTIQTTGLESTTDSGERLYDYVNQRERGDGVTLFWDNHVTQVTEEELRKLYNADDNGQLRDAFGSFDNYLAYMDERQDLLDSGELRADWWTSDEALIDINTMNPDDDRAMEEEIRSVYSSYAEQAYNEGSDALGALYQKYTGEGLTRYNNDGDKFQWNGSSFVKTVKVDDSINMNNMFLLAAVAGLSAGALSPGVTAAVGGGFTGGAVTGAVSSTIAQGLVTGKIDPASVVSAGIMGGIGGWFNELNAATPGAYGGWVDANGVQISNFSQWTIEKTQWLSNTLGIPFSEASGIVQGVVEGTVSQEDLEGIALNAVGGWSNAKIQDYLTNQLGDGFDVDNWFREGNSHIPTEALFPFVETGIQAAIDGGVSKTDLLKMLGGYFQAGGDLDFILPALPELGIDIGSLGVDFPDFCEEFPKLCEWGSNLELPDVNLPDVNLPDVNLPDIKCPEWAKDSEGNCLGTADLGNIELCSPEQLEKGGKTIRIGSPDSWYCQLPDLPDLPDVPDTNIGCPEGWDVDEDGVCIEPPSLCGEGYSWDPELEKCMPDVESKDIDADVDIELPDVDLPGIDLPDISGDMPSVPEYNASEGPTGLSYSGPQIPTLFSSPYVDSVTELNEFIKRQLQRKPRSGGGMLT